MTQDYQDGFELAPDAAAIVWEPVNVTGPLTLISITMPDGRVVFDGPIVLENGETLRLVTRVQRMTPEERAHRIVERCKNDPDIVAVIKAAVLVEREACARLCEEGDECFVPKDGHEAGTHFTDNGACGVELAAAIRARTP